jgi:uncharacterized protein (TIGR01777 family)
LRVLVTGASGLIGTALVPALAAAGHRVTRLVRAQPRGPDEFAWDPGSGMLDPSVLQDCQAVVHLAGESIAGGRWTPRRKARIRQSRVTATRLLATGIAQANPPPATMICASAIGYYGDRGDQVLDETSGPGSGFLAELVRDWEAATEPASRAGIRVAHLRLGMVLSGRAGALPRMLLPFVLGLGGPIGGGRQWMSWITLGDAIGAFDHALNAPDLRGPVNVVAPRPVSNREFARTLGRVLGRPALLPLPGWAVRFLFGELGEELLLYSQRVLPGRLLASGYRHTHPELEGALRSALGKERPNEDSDGKRGA